MPIETIEFNGAHYFALQSQGFAAKFAFQFAKLLCQPKGTELGYDIGCNRQEWALPGAIPIDPALPDCEYDAYHLPFVSVDFIFSSHCLEHLPNYVDAINYWISKLQSGGVLFLYLPDCEQQQYWRPWNNRKHIHYLTPALIENLFNSLSGVKNIRVTGTDLNCSFYAVLEKV